MSIAAYPTYESYKDSGIDWIAEIPAHWAIQPVRANFAFRNEKNNPIYPDFFGTRILEC